MSLKSCVKVYGLESKVVAVTYLGTILCKIVAIPWLISLQLCLLVRHEQCSVGFSRFCQVDEKSQSVD